VHAGSKLPPLDDLGDETFSDIDPIVAQESEKAFDSLPFAYGEEEGSGITQNVGQPCYLRNGAPPKDEDESCKDAQQVKPVFDGKQSYYNSGIIPYEGPEGNTFEVPLADDIDPGKYWFYCAVHGAFQATEVEVLERGADAPSETEINRRARREIDKLAEPLLGLYRQALRRNRVNTHDELNEELTVKGPFAGISDATIGFGHALINEFVPKRLEVKAGEPITWRMMGSDHTISFGVPRYFPVMEFLDDGTVRLNRRIDPPAGGAKEPPEQEGMGVYKVDGGNYDGTGFWSSGLIGGSPYAEYTMRISKPGTYDFACLIHPPMVGKIEVS
jgi:plastocyanin